jgi:hypothetical protein
MPYSLPPTPQPLNEIRPSAKKRTSAPVHSFTLIVISNRSFLCERGARSEVHGASGTSNRSSRSNRSNRSRSYLRPNQVRVQRHAA